MTVIELRRETQLSKLEEVEEENDSSRDFAW